MKSNEPARKSFNKYGKGRCQHFWDTIFKDVDKAVNGMAVFDTLGWPRSAPPHAQARHKTAPDTQPFGRDPGRDPDPEHRVGRPEPRAAERPGLQGYSVFISRKIGMAPGLIDTGLYLRRRSRSKNNPAPCPQNREPKNPIPIPAPKTRIKRLKPHFLTPKSAL